MAWYNNVGDLKSALGLSDENAQKEAAIREQKRIAGIKETREKRGHKISGANKEIKTLDRQIAEAKKAVEAEEALKQKMLTSQENASGSAAKKLAELEQRKVKIVENRDSLIGISQKKNKNKNTEQKTEAPKTEAPKTEAPKTEAPKTEAPKTEAPKTEAPKTEAPKVQTNIDLAKEGKLHADPERTAAKERIAVLERQTAGVEKAESVEGATKGVVNKEVLKTELDASKKSLEELNKAAHKNFDKMTSVERLKSSVAGNFGKAGGHMAVRIARGGAALGAVAYAGKKGIEIFSPELDEKGERKEGLFVTTAKATAALAATAALLLHGGRNRAMGI